MRYGGYAVRAGLKPTYFQWKALTLSDQCTTHLSDHPRDIQVRIVTELRTINKINNPGKTVDKRGSSVFRWLFLPLRDLEVPAHKPDGSDQFESTRGSVAVVFAI